MQNMTADDKLSGILARMNERFTKVPVDLSQYECPICKDTEFTFYNDEKGYQYAKPCECRQLKIAKRLLARSGISEEFQTKTFNNFNDRGLKVIHDAKQKAIDYYKSFSANMNDRVNSIMFCGQVGSGKTHLGMALANNLIKTKKIAVLYMEYRMTATKLKQLITNDYDYNTELTKYKTAKVLFIDDLLKGKTTEADVNLLYEIINYRYLNKLPLIISTEKTRSELIDFDEAIASRIIEMCGENIIELEGQELNYRLFK